MKTILGLFLLAAVLTGEASPLPATPCTPSATMQRRGDVTTFVRRHYPGARILDRDTDDGRIEVKIRHEGKEKIVYFTRAGRWLCTEWELRRERLPKAVVSAVARKGFPFRTIDDNDRVDLGNPFPKVTFGFNFNVSAYGFDLTMTSSGQAGNKIFSALRRPDLNMSNYPAWILNRWHGEGTSNTIPRVTTNDSNQNWTRPSDFYLQDGSFWRIRNITLGYTVQIPERFYLKSVRVFASVDNVYTFTKYTGYDPEIGNGGSILSSGIDKGIYPRPRVVSFGLNLSF